MSKLEPYTLCAACAICALVLARVVEIAGGSRPLSRSIAGEALRTGLHLALFAIFLLAVWRPVTALVLLFVSMTAVEIASKAKKALLGEAVVFSDLTLVGQILRHPQLYYISPREYRLPYLALLIGALLVGYGVFAEPSIGLLAPLFLLGAAGALFAGAMTSEPELIRADALLSPPDHGATDFGLLAALFLQSRAWASQRQAARAEITDPTYRGDCDLIILQMESFADLPALGCAQEPLELWNELKSKAAFHGPLAVEALGANTIRTEFAVLSGLPGASLGFDRFNPYLRPERYAAQAWPQRLGRAGWATTFIHPNDARFFRRDTTVAALGFSSFLAKESFRGATRFGPHISDEAVVDAILHRLDRADAPQFIFAVTMENHGPWNPPRIGKDVAPVDAYLTHLHNAELALTKLIDALARRKRRAIVAAYGDHLPALSEIRAALPGNDTSYLIMDTAGLRHRPAAPSRIEPHHLLQRAMRLAETGAPAMSSARVTVTAQEPAAWPP